MRSGTLENLISLINSANSAETPIALEDVDVSVPYAVNKDGCNTEVEVTIKPTYFPLRGKQTFRYNRLPIDTVVKGDLELYMDPEMRNSYDMIPYLNQQLNIELTENDVINDPVIGQQHTFRAASTSYQWKDLALVLLKQATPLDEVILTTALDGLKYPDTQDPKGQASVYSYGIDCSRIAPFLWVMDAGVDFDDTALAVEFNKTVPELWVSVPEAAPWNLRDSQCVYEGLTTGLPGSNTMFKRVVSIELGPLCSNFAGTLNLHYNP
ncbi:hypothetical protein pEaSNUABM38_00135 [Erwinia phage pEa_SNUABM_38]|nr:hypothetical protein pEaSNUABM38_00135 [Erwinia phage pEa_SNUABM_38]